MAEQINLVGRFDDGISPKLKRLNKNIRTLEKSFAKLGKSMAKVSKTSQKPLARINRSLEAQQRSINGATKSWRGYERAVRRANRTARGFRQPRVGNAPMAPRRGGGAARGVGGSGIGFTGFTAASVAAGIALNTLEAAARQVSQVFGTIVSAAVEMEGNIIQMASSFQVMGGLSWESSMLAAENALTGIEAIAAALPGDTGGYVSVATALSDDMFLMFETMEGVQENLALGTQSLVALYGMASQIANLPIRVSARDATQIREGDFENVSLFRELPALRNAVEKNVAAGMSNMEALYAGLKSVITPEMIKESQQTLSAQIEEFNTRVFSPKTGLLGGLRTIQIDGVATTFAKELGQFFNALYELVDVMSAAGLDPMVAFAKGIRFFTSIVKQVTEAVEFFHVGAGSFEDLAHDFGSIAGDITGKLINAIASIDFFQLAKGFDQFVYGFAKGLINAIDFGQLAQGFGNALLAAFRTFTGFTLTVIGFSKLNSALGGVVDVVQGFKNVIAQTVNALSGKQLMKGGGKVLTQNGDEAVKGLGLFGKHLVKTIPGLSKLGKAFKPLSNILKPLSKGFGQVAKRIPGLNVLFAGLDFAARKAEGQDTATAASGAGGALIGGIAGGALGSFLGPIGTVIGGVIGSWLGGWVGEKLPAVFKSLGIDIGPFISTLGTAWSALSGWFVEGSRRMVATWTAFTGVLSAGWDKLVGWFAPAASLIGDAFGAYFSFLGELGSAFIKLFTDPVGAIGDAFNAFSNLFTTTIPSLAGRAFGMAVSGIKAAFGAYVRLYTEVIPNLVKGALKLAGQGLLIVWDNFVSVITSIPGLVMGGVQNIGSSIKSVAELIVSGAKALGASIAAIPGLVMRGIERLGKLFTQDIPYAIGYAIGFAVGAIKQGFQNILTTIQAVPGLVMKGVERLGKLFTQDIPNAVGSAIGFMVGLVMKGVERLTKLFTQDLPYAIGYAIGFAVGAIKQGWQNIVRLFTQTIPNAARTAFNATVSFVTSAAQAVWTFFTTTLPNAARSAFTSMVSAVTSAAQAVWTFFTVTIPTAATNAFNSLIALISATWQRVVSFILGLPAKLAAAFSGFITWLTELPGKIQEKVDAFLTEAATIPTKVTSWLGDVSSAIVSWAKDIPGKVRGALGNAWGNFVSGLRGGENNVPTTPASTAFNGNTTRTMPLPEAIKRETAQKPPGSHLVIANSSETIIPRGMKVGQAAGGMFPNAPSNKVVRFQRKLIGNLTTLNKGLNKLSTGGLKLSGGKLPQTPSTPLGVMPRAVVSSPAKPGQTRYEAAARPALQDMVLEFNKQPLVTPPNNNQSSVTTNIGDIKVSVTAAPGMNEDQLANAVAKKVMEAVTDVTYDELYLS